MDTDNNRTGIGTRVANPRIRVIRVRVSETEHESITKAADLNAQTVSEAIREAVNEWAADCQDGPVFVDDSSGAG